MALCLLVLLGGGNVWGESLAQRSKVAAPAREAPEWWNPERMLQPTTSTSWTGWYAGAFGAHSASDSSGDEVGGYLGYQWHWQPGVVLGFEIDAGKAWYRDRDREISREVEFASSARVRAGWATGQVLAYVTGGIGAQSQVFTASDDEVVVRDRGWAAPWVYGAGVEVRVSEKVNARVEVLRTEGEAFEWDQVADRRDTVRLGVGYKF